MTAPEQHSAPGPDDGEAVASTIPGYSGNPAADPQDDTDTQSTIPGYSSRPGAPDGLG